MLHHLKSKGFHIYIHEIKVAAADGAEYYYPDVFAPKEIRTEKNHYIKYEPKIIIGVISPSTHITDTVDN
ncbi:MAG: hypothetical protein ACXWWC_14885 [Chitinophagaceae bacterium]